MLESLGRIQSLLLPSGWWWLSTLWVPRLAAVTSQSLLPSSHGSSVSVTGLLLSVRVMYPNFLFSYIDISHIGSWPTRLTSS